MCWGAIKREIIKRCQKAVRSRVVGEANLGLIRKGCLTELPINESSCLRRGISKSLTQASSRGLVAGWERCTLRLNGRWELV